jgi:hypothetical protein
LVLRAFQDPCETHMNVAVPDKAYKSPAFFETNGRWVGSKRSIAHLLPGPGPLLMLSLPPDAEEL